MFYYKSISYNHSSRNGNKIKYLVLHQTDNEDRGADALRHHKYFSGGNRGASAHYFVDDKNVVQIIPDGRSAWAVAGNQGHGVALNGATNQNSLSIEMCVNKDGDYKKAYDLTVETFKNLMKKYPYAIICRHYDITRKNCPSKFSKSDWEQFRKDIKEDVKIKIDLSKTSEFVKEEKQLTKEEVLKIVREEKESIENSVMQKWQKDAIQYVKDNNIMQGYKDGSFKPNKPVTRAELAQVIYNMSK